jgi:photosystem II stability/assembly factor-like uncharacterized protein
MTIAGIIALSVLSGVRDAVRAASSPVNYLQVDFTSVSNGVVTAQRGTSFWLETTNDGGTIWTSHRLRFALFAAADASTEPAVFGRTMSFIDSKHGWMAGYNRTSCPSSTPDSKCELEVLATHNGGSSWSTVLSLPHADSVDSIQMVSKNYGWVISSQCKKVAGGESQRCGYNQRIRQTRDGGRTWNQVSWQQGSLTQLAWSDASAAWMAAGNRTGDLTCAGALYRTTDGGSSWTKKLTLAHQCQIAFAFSGTAGWVATTTASACTSGGCPEQVRVTSNGGKSWTLGSGQPPLQAEGFLQDAELFDSQHGYLTFALGGSLNTEGGIVTTPDGGKTWSRSYPCYSILPGGASSPSAESLWVAGTWVSYCSQPRGTGLFESTDWGQEWKQVSTGL